MNLKFSVCTDAVFRGQDTASVIPRVAAAGFSYIEFWGWQGKDLRAIRRAADENGVTVAACCVKQPSLVDPAARNVFLSGLDESIQAAKVLGAKVLLTQAGQDTGAPRKTQTASLIEGLSLAASRAEDAGITLVLEPLNTRYDHKGYFLWSTEETAQVIDAVASPAVKILYDIYHQQIMEGDIVGTLLGNLPRIGHIHTAGHPGRHELTDGELNYRYVLARLDEAGYAGIVGLEYFPLLPPEEGFNTFFQMLK